jgi:hypothetical protein
VRGEGGGRRKKEKGRRKEKEGRRKKSQRVTRVTVQPRGTRDVPLAAAGIERQWRG